MAALDHCAAGTAIRRQQRRRSNAAGIPRIGEVACVFESRQDVEGWMKNGLDLLGRHWRWCNRDERFAIRPECTRAGRRALQRRERPRWPCVPGGEDAAERLERFTKGRAPGQQFGPLAGERRHPGPPTVAWPASIRTNLIRKPPASTSAARSAVSCERSEERRVGKEGRARWSPEQ